MKHLILFSLALIALQGCICPDPVEIEFDNTIKAVTVLSEGYYISEVTITEYVPQKGSVSLIDSNKADIVQSGPRGAIILSIIEPAGNYIVTGDSLQALLKKKNLRFRVQLKRAAKKEKNSSLDVEEIIFVKDEIKHDQEKFNSKHPCP